MPLPTLLAVDAENGASSSPISGANRETAESDEAWQRSLEFRAGSKHVKNRQCFISATS